MQQAGSFAAGVFVILAGVRLILAEIVPAFKGISEKLVPNAIPALDCPIVFPYAPNAVLIGFLTSFVGGIVSLIIMVFTGTTVIIPGVVPHFFCGATAGVYGNATGGVRGAVIGSFIHGIIISFMPILLMPVMGILGSKDQLSLIPTMGLQDLPRKPSQYGRSNRYLLRDNCGSRGLDRIDDFQEKQSGKICF